MKDLSIEPSVLRVLKNYPPLSISDIAELAGATVAETRTVFNLIDGGGTFLIGVAGEKNGHFLYYLYRDYNGLLKPRNLVCVNCGHEYQFNILQTCPKCGYTLGEEDVED